MKKLVVIFCLGTMIVSCGGSDSKESKEEARQEAAQTAEQSPEYKKGLELVGKSDCFTCHKVSEAFIAPSYEAVAARYEMTAPVLDTLAEKIIKGGAGRWGTVPMTAHPQISEDDAKAMVKYIMSLKK